MKRRDFLTTSAGFIAFMTLSGAYRIQKAKSVPKSIKFRDYQTNTSFGKVKIVTPNDGYYIHTFFDVCPFSPSQKLLAVNKLPYQGKDAKYGDVCDICIIDLENETIEKVYSTKGWGYQLGANLNWGKTDRFIYTNDIIDNQAVCVKIDLQTKEAKAYCGPMYHIAPDESTVIGFPLDTINVTQMGYGVPKFKEYDNIIGAPTNQGLWQTNLKTNRKKLLVSLNDVLQHADDPKYFKGSNDYFFHSKYNRQGTRIFQVMRCLFPEIDISSKNSVTPDHTKEGWNPMLFTFNADGTNVKQTVTRSQWSFGGNHPNWHPDGEHIIMNIKPGWLGDTNMRFSMFHYTGKEFKILSHKHKGTGHPSVNADFTYLLSDYYVDEYKALGLDGAPIRLINLNTDEEVYICTVFTDVDSNNETFRIDPHPVWSHDYKKVCFNGAPEGKRQVFIADLTEVLKI
jgi:Tol biopolymer transport system component